MKPGDPIRYGFDWAEFRKWLDGTYGRCAYTWSEDPGAYSITTLDTDLPRLVSVAKVDPASLDQKDFEQNWKKLSNSPRLQLNSSGSVTSLAPATESFVCGVAFGQIATSATTNVPLRGTTYAEPTVAAQRSVSSSSANDRAVSTGAREVTITYYDASMNGPFTDKVVLNGATAVATGATDICFIENMRVTSAGSGGTNAGVITLFTNTTGGAGAIASIAASAGVTQFTHHYVASGRVAYITQMNGAVTANASVLTLIQRDLIANVNQQVSEAIRSATAQASIVRVFSQPICIVGPSRVIMYVQPSSAAAMTTYGSFDYYEI